VSPEMRIPLVKAINVQLAGRYEHYSDFGSVAKPKLALAWDVNDSVRLRASFSRGFKAPNLETTADYTYGRAVGVNDYTRCEADIRARRLTNFNACARSLTARYFISGNPELGPETSNTSNIGIVLQPSFIPAALGRFTLTLDRWKIDQVGIVGVLGAGNIVAQDYLSRVGGGAGSAAVVRAAPNADDIALFAGTGLTPVGVVTDVRDMFMNLQPQQISGYDMSVNWRKRTSEYGSFDVNLNIAYMDKYMQSPLSGIDNLFAAREAGTINPATPLSDPGNRLRSGARPSLKGAANATWKGGAWQVGVSMSYIGAVYDDEFLTSAGEPWRVEDQALWNGYLQYAVRSEGMLKDVRLRLGARNLFDKAPPLSQNGYNGGLYNPYGRYLYLNLSKTF
jgi:iron complex outermembrane receptor protein